MQKSQRYGLLLLALICVAITAVSVWRSRTAAERLGYDAPHPSEFTILSAAPPADGSRNHAGKDTIFSDRHEKRKSAKKSTKKSRKEHSKEAPQKTQKSDRRWLDDL